MFRSSMDRSRLRILLLTAGLALAFFSVIGANPALANSLEAEANETTLEGTVSDAGTGAPLPNASVTVIADGGTDEATTDSEGSFELTGLPVDGDYAVTVEKRGYEPTTETRTAPADETAIDVALAGAGTIDVAVTDAHFGDGIETGTVRATGSHGTYSGDHVGDGTYRLEPLPSGDDYDLQVRAEGYVDDERTVTLSEGEKLVESVPLRGDALLEIAVETEDGEPIEDATVSVARDGEVAADAPSTSDESGTLEAVVPGTGESYAVEASAPEFESATVDTGAIESEETAAVTVALPAPLPVSIPHAIAASILLASLLAVLLVRTYGSEPR